jgi:hypothetical protein
LEKGRELPKVNRTTGEREWRKRRKASEDRRKKGRERMRKKHKRKGRRQGKKGLYQLWKGMEWRRRKLTTNKERSKVEGRKYGE